MKEKLKREYVVFEESCDGGNNYVVEIYSIRDKERILNIVVRESDIVSLDPVVGAVRRAGFGDREEDMIVTTIPVLRIGRIRESPLDKSSLSYFYRRLRSD